MQNKPKESRRNKIEKKITIKGIIERKQGFMKRLTMLTRKKDRERAREKKNNKEKWGENRERKN